MSSTHRHLLLDFFWQVISGPLCIIINIFLLLLEVSLDWKRREVVLSRGYGHIQQSIVRAEVFAGKMKSTHSVAVIPTL
jgi:hypothetical protein